MKIILALMLAGAVAAKAAEPAVELAEAARPLAEGVPEVAVVRLKRLLTTASPQTAGAIKEKLAEALLSAQRPNDALQILQELTSSPAKMLRAETLAQLARPAEALAILQEILRNQPDDAAAAFAAAQMLRLLGRDGEALAQFRVLERNARFGVSARLEEAEIVIARNDRVGGKRILDLADARTTAQKRQKRLLRGRWELLNHRPERAANLFESLVKKTEGASRETIVAALFALGDAHLEMETPESGDDFLENFIDRHPNDPTLPQIFVKLAQLYRAERKPPRAELERWAHDEAEPRRGLARWYLAQFDLAAGRRETALRQFEELRKSRVPALAPALLQYSRLLLEDHHFEEARAVADEAQTMVLPEELRAAFAYERARADYANGNYLEAANGFEHLGPRFPGAARYNAALAWMQSGENVRAEATAREAGAEGDAKSAADLLLEEGLLAALKNDGGAAAKLHEFLQRNPGHPRVAEANLALAEIAFHATPPRLREAENFLGAARTGSPSPATKERADYLGVWLEDARGANSAELIDVATEFLRAHHGSPFAADIRLKLGEAHFRRQDFANAETQFELLAQENPDSPLAEKALFLAAQSAASTMGARALDHALDLLAQVIKRDGEFRWTAQNEQAGVARRLGKLADAQLLYEEVLKGDARPAEKREALCGKADVLSEESSREPAKLNLAMAAYEQLASEAANQPHWRNQALFKKGVCQEKQGTPDEALATLYRVLDFDPQPDRAPEFFWFYKAGFDAAHLLETQEKWQSAAAIYDRLVAASGPRSEEAKARLTQLRLEHFLW